MSSYGGLGDDGIGSGRLVIALASCHQGQNKDGVDHGWQCVSGCEALLDSTFVDFRDQKKFERPVNGSMIMGRNIHHALKQAASVNGFAHVPLLCLGGDHTISIGTVDATKKIFPNTRLIWIDAHPDINTPCSSFSGHCHGMPVAHLMNLVDGFKIANPIEPHEILYLGLRDIDDAEQLRLDSLAARGALIYLSSVIIERGISAILTEIDSIWLTSSPSFSFPVHVSLDIDSIDPSFAPATGTPVPNGLHPSQICQVLQWANQRAWQGLCHLDLVEVNPLLSSARGAFKTISTAKKVLRAWIESHQLLEHAEALKSTGQDPRIFEKAHDDEVDATEINYDAAA